MTGALGPSCSGSGFDKLEFSYDGEGHRTKIVATPTGGAVTTTEFRYQGDAVIEEKVNAAVARTFVVDEAGSIVKMTFPTGANAGDYLVNWNGHGDALQLLRIKPDGTTELANSFTYSTWGAPTIDATHDNSNNGGADYGDLGFRYLYVGEFDVQWDNTYGLGLHYMHARHYAPALGRFLQPDPDGLEDSLYAYAANNPITEMDPDGTCFIVCQVAVGAVIGAVVNTATYLATTDSSQWNVGSALGAAGSGAVLGAATSVGLGAVGVAARVTLRATAAATRASAPVVRAAVTRMAKGAIAVPFKHPSVMRFVSPRVAAPVARAAGWTVKSLGRGSQRGSGVRMLEPNLARPGYFTGRSLRYHPGGGHHGARPYWKVMQPNKGSVRVYR